VGSEGVQVFDLETGILEQQLTGHSAPVEGVAFLGAGEKLLSASQDSLILWDLPGETSLDAVEVDWQGFEDMALSPDEEWVAVAHRTHVELRPLTDLSQGRTLPGDSSGTLTVAFSPDSKLLALGRRDGEVRVVEVADGSTVHSLEGHDGYVTALDFTTDGLTLITAGDDRRMCFWEVITGELLRQRPLLHRAWSQDLKVSLDGGLLASAGADGVVLLWDLVRSRLLQRLEGHFRPLHAIAFGPMGDWLVSGGEDSTLRVWDLRSLTGS
jgi:hypothetical protein